MVTYSEASQMLSEIIDTYPPELMEGLSGGVILAQERKLHPKSKPTRPLYIMGQYCRDSIGTRIYIYYGSFCAVHGRKSSEEFREHLRDTFRHEMRHHMERRSGITDLNKYDDERMELYEAGEDISHFEEPPIG